jgi:2-phosphosulfolactate phosphatase
MSKSVEVEVVLSHSERLPIVDVWMVVDILRATTVMVSWFAAGGGDLYPVDSIESAAEFSRVLRQEGQTPVLMGERNAVMPEGFDLGNSPLDMTRELTARYSCAVMATTNGTRAFLKAASMGVPVLAVCARNAFAALDLALSKGRRVGIFCSGRKGRPAWDDTLCAGLLVARLKEYLPEIRLADSARLAWLSWRSAGAASAPLGVESPRVAGHSALLEKIGLGKETAIAPREYFPEARVTDGVRFAAARGSAASFALVRLEAAHFEASLRTADHATFLEKIGFGADIAFAAEVDVVESVPELHEIPDGDDIRVVLREGRLTERRLALQNASPPEEDRAKFASEQFFAPTEPQVAHLDAPYVFFAGKEHEKRYGNRRRPDY